MKKFNRLLLTVLFLIAYVSFPKAAAADLTTPPSNIEAFENNLNQSLIETSCGGVRSVGFAGNYTITQEMKDKGQNTLILTTGTGMKSCRIFGTNIPLVYQKKDYTGSIQWWNGQNPDFATVVTSLNVPTLPLYSSSIPYPGTWVDVVQNVVGFGLVWSHSKVILYNDKMLYFMIDPILPAATENALVFNNQGTFIGVVTSSQPGVPAGQVIVQGAPLQCGLNNQSVLFPTGCGKKAVEYIPK